MNPTNKIIGLLSGLAVMLLVPAGLAGTARFDRQMKPLYGEYQKIHDALAADRLGGVDSAAKRIAKLAGKLDPSKVSGEHAGHYRHLPKKIKAAATKLEKVEGLNAKREAFKELSRPLAMWATMSKPAGVNVVYCSMARGSWLQRDAKIRNPYYGASMLRCGEVVSGKDRGKADGHMKHKGHRGHEH
jgi:Cu(I)/Ag(I) efflux system membrane fusion protein